MDALGLNAFVIVHWPEYIRLTIIAVIRSIDVVIVSRIFSGCFFGSWVEFFIKIRVIANMSFQSQFRLLINVSLL